MQLRPQKHATKQESSQLASGIVSSSDAESSNGAASFEALSRIARYLPIWVQILIRPVNILFSSAVDDALYRILLALQKRACYLIDLESLGHQFRSFASNVCSCPEDIVIELRAFILEFLDQNCGLAINLQAFFVNCCAISDLEEPKLQTIVGRICENNALTLQQFGWLRYRRHFGLEPSFDHFTNDGMFYHERHARDAAVCDHANLTKWLATMPHVTTLYVPAMESLELFDRRYSIATLSAAEYDQRVLECWKPLLMHAEEDPLSKLQRLYFASVNYDSEQEDFTFVGLLSALGKLNTMQISQVSLLTCDIIEWLMVYNDDTWYSALRNLLIQTFPNAMLEFRQIVLKSYGSHFLHDVCYDKFNQFANNLIELFNDNRITTIGRIDMHLLSIPQNGTNTKNENTTTPYNVQYRDEKFQRLCRILTFMRQCQVPVRFHFVLLEASKTADFYDDEDSFAPLGERIYKPGEWDAVADTVRSLFASNKSQYRAAACSLTFSPPQDLSEPYHKVFRTFPPGFSTSLRNMLFAQAEGILADKPWAYAEITLGDAYFIDRVRSRSRWCRTFRKVHLDCSDHSRTSYDHSIKLRNKF